MAAILAFVLVVVFVFAFININIWGEELINEMTGEITTANGYTNESVAVITSADNNYSSLMDGVAIFAFLGFWLLAVILAYNSASHPFIGVLAVLLVIVVAVVGMMLSNTWSDISTDSDVSTIAAGFPMSGFILDNYLLYVLAVGVSVVLAFFWGANSL